MVTGLVLRNAPKPGLKSAREAAGTAIAMVIVSARQLDHAACRPRWPTDRR
jgi:hypothetical protein